MFLTTRAASRPYHLGSYPLEAPPREPQVVEVETAQPAVASKKRSGEAQGPLARASRDYLDIFVANAVRTPAPARAPIPDDPHRRMVDVKGYGYFMNASQVGICRMPASAWYTDAKAIAEHTYAVVLLLQHGRTCMACRQRPAKRSVK